MSALDNLRRERIGMAGYVRLLAALPATIEQAAERCWLCRNTAAKLLREFGSLRIAHVGGVAKGRPRSSPVMVWHFGDGEDVMPRRMPKAAPRAATIAFASVIRALREHRSIAELVEETGVHSSVLRKIVAELRARRMCHIGSWERRHGCPIARHTLGRGPDTKRPQALTKQQINAVWNRVATQRRRMLRLIGATAGRNTVGVPANAAQERSAA